MTVSPRVVDISAIPVAAIDRVEIVADGSSALYGSDAVGGVANIILRRDFAGLITSARFGASTDGGNEQQQYNAVAGKVWASGGIMAAFDFNRSTAITARNRSYGQNLDDTATFLPSQTQYSGVLSGHQQISERIEFTVDGQFNDRATTIANPFLTTTSVFANGLLAQPETTSYTITPSLKFELPGAWEASISGDPWSKQDRYPHLIYEGGSLSVDAALHYYNDLNVAEAAAEGPLFAISGGDVRLAVGGGYRSIGLDVKVVQSSGGISQTTADTSNGRMSRSAMVSCPFLW